jgi:MinD-like ATPase involved in chromosome partitioning or flagellar assembly
VSVFDDNFPTTGEVYGELHEPSGSNLVGALPESLTINVDLPEPVRSVPEHEVAVSIDTTSVSPTLLDASDSGTRSISLIPDRAAITAEETASGYSRRGGAHVASPESASMLTADRLIASRKQRRHAPEGRWPSFVYAATFHAINLGDSRTVRERKAVDARIAKVFEGGTRFVPVLTRKGGVGKTTITTLIGMAMASVREDRIIAIDANPDRGTLSERINKQTRSTVRDVVTRAASINGFTDFSTLVSRDETRLDVLASDTDPLLSEAFDENDYNVVADLATRFYDVALTDCGTGIVHSVMRATLQRADSIVIVSGGSIDESRLASETLTWLEANGYGDLVRNAIVVINTATHGTNLVKLEEIEDHFRSRVRDTVRMPYDQQLAAGSVIDYKNLQKITRDASRELAALVMDGLPAVRNV